MHTMLSSRVPNQFRNFLGYYFRVKCHVLLQTVQTNVSKAKLNFGEHDNNRNSICHSENKYTTRV